jgi:hypothetical protein
MENYQVQYQVIAEDKLYFIKNFEVRAGQLYIVYDKNERLTFKQAENRRNQILERYSALKLNSNLFKICEVKSDDLEDL